MHILLVEDEEAHAELIRRAFEDQNELVNLTLAPNLRQAKDFLTAHTPDLVITDLLLPDGQGVDLLPFDRQNVPYPIIVMTSHGDEQIAVEAMKAGALDYLVKSETTLADMPRLVQRVMREWGYLVQRKQAEVALRTSEERFKSIFENAIMGLYRSTPDGRILMANPALVRMLGYATVEELAQRNLENSGFIQESTRSIFKQQIEREGRVVGLESIWVKRDGSPLFIRESATAIYNEFGNLLYYEGTVEDITGRKQAEEEIRRRNRELTLLNRVIAASVTRQETEEILEIACGELGPAFDMPRVSAFLFNPDKTQATLMAEYMTQERSVDLYTPVPINTNPVFQYMLIQKAPIVLDNVQNNPQFAAAYTMMRQRGTVAALVVPLNVGGTVIGCLQLETRQLRHFSTPEINLVWTVADQVAMTLTRASFDKERRQLSAAIEQMAEAVIITDTANHILYVNPAFEGTTGYTRAEVMGQVPDLLRAGSQDDSIYHEISAIITAGRVWHGRLINKKKDGTPYTAEETITPARDEHGVIANYVIVERDVTRELQLEEQIRQAQKMEAVGRLTAGIAHDFNNLLTVINGFAELMQDKLTADDPLVEPLEKILRSGQRAADLTRQLLAFSRKQIIQPRVILLNTIVTELDRMLRRIIGEDIELKMHLAPDLWPIKVDPSQMDQIIINVAVNARDAMPSGGHLLLETSNVTLDQGYVRQHPDVIPGDYVLLAISDNGVGMSDEVREMVFEPFFTTKEVGQGTGLGLAMVFGIVKQHRGHIWVYSELGRGTTFKLYLPRVFDEIPVTLYSQPPTKLPRGEETILLVEDEPEVRELAARVLRRQVYIVLEAKDGHEALHVARTYQRKIDLLLTDVVMPQMSGRALADVIITMNPDTKILFASGYTDGAIAHHGVLNVGTRFIQKPFSPAHLANKVREVLDE